MDVFNLWKFIKLYTEDLYLFLYVLYSYQKFVYNLKTKFLKAFILQTLWTKNAVSRNLAHGND